MSKTHRRLGTTKCGYFDSNKKKQLKQDALDFLCSREALHEAAANAITDRAEAMNIAYPELNLSE